MGMFFFLFPLFFILPVLHSPSSAIPPTFPSLFFLCCCAVLFPPSRKRSAERSEAESGAEQRANIGVERNRNLCLGNWMLLLRRIIRREIRREIRRRGRGRGGEEGDGEGDGGVLYMRRWAWAWAWRLGCKRGDVGEKRIGSIGSIGSTYR